MLLHVEEKREPVHLRQEQVRQYEIDPSSCGQQIHCCSSVRRFPAIESISKQPWDDNVADRLLILDQKDSWKVGVRSPLGDTPSLGIDSN